MRSAEINSDVEKAGAFPAEIAFAAALVGLVLGLLGFVGGGWCAVVGLGSLLQIYFSIGDYDVSLHVGYELALVFFCWAGVLHFRRLRKRRPGVNTGTGFRGAIAAMAISAAAIAVMILCLVLHVLWLAPLLWAGGVFLVRAAKASGTRRLGV